MQRNIIKNAVKTRKATTIGRTLSHANDCNLRKLSSAEKLKFSCPRKYVNFEKGKYYIFYSSDLKYVVRSQRQNLFRFRIK